MSIAHVGQCTLSRVSSATGVRWVTGRGSERWWAPAGGAAGGDPSAGEGGDGEVTPPAHRRLAKSFSVSASRPREKTAERSKDTLMFRPTPGVANLFRTNDSYLNISTPAACL